MHIHLDPLGGMAGDMFIAAMTDAFPEIRRRLEQIIAEADFPQIEIVFSSKNDGVLVGSGFKVLSSESSAVSDPGDAVEQHAHEHPHISEHRHYFGPLPGEHLQAPGAAHHHKHAHRTYAEIRRILEEAHLPEKVREHSLEIFRIIGEAEAEVHGVDPAEIAFHEVGGWDSVVDVVGAACVIDYLEDATWSCRSVPLGGGFIETAHGKLPVPPPAVALLLRGFVFHDDGVMGERVTPTGAAILKYLEPQPGLPALPLELKQTGFGFGTKKMPGLSNVLRILAFEEISKATEESITVLNFEVDDMTGEELAVSLDKLRAADGVLDVVQTPVYGKKNRLAVSVQVLAGPASAGSVIKEILSKTTTLGVRHQTVSRTILPRAIVEVKLGETGVRVKVADRPNGRKTAKIDIDDVAGVSGDCFELRKLAGAAESDILKDINE